MTDSLPGLAPGSVAALLSDWTGAERAGDASRLESLLIAGFRAVGPLGFILPRDARLARHRAVSFLAGTRGAPPIPGSSR